MPVDDFDSRPTIRITTTIMEHPKIVELSDAAFRGYFEALTYCARQETNGKITKAASRRIGTPKVIKELVQARLLEVSGQDYEVHDYLKHQRSSTEIQSFRDARSADGALGAHKRWHVPRRQRNKDCEYCLKEAESA